MKKLLTILISAVCGSSVWAVPQLQLDIAGGHYDAASETVMANGNPFTLYALFNARRGDPSGTYYISAAIVPQSTTDFGSFSIDGVVYSLSSGMQYGTPPVDSTFPGLESHGVYPTYYAEIPFTFDPSQKAGKYESQVSPGGLVPDDDGSIVYRAFTVDITGLTSGVHIHFDLYDTLVRRQVGGSYSYAPFTHDAESGSTPGRAVPEGGSVILMLSAGLSGCYFVRRKWASAAKNR